MIGFGFTTTCPIFVQSIRDRYRVSNRCHRDRVFSPSRTASISTLPTVLCANSELPRKRGRPKGSKNKSKSENGQKGEKVQELYEASIDSIKLQSKRKRGRPRALANDVEQKIVAQFMQSKTGEFQNSPVKRKRGRPRGSKNKPKVTSSSSGTPFDSIYDNATAAAQEDAELDLLDLFEKYHKSHVQDFQNPPEQDWKEVRLKAPNGLPGSGPDDFIFELLPLVAKMEAEQNRVVPEKEKKFRRYMDVVFHQFASSHRSDGRQRNLKPFKLREDEKKVCVKCEGLGMIKCDYCEGYGFVDFGENAERFFEEFGTDNMPLPKHVMGTMYHCPYCNGACLEDCDECSGTGSTEDRVPRKPGSSRTPVNNYAKEEFNFEEFLEREKDRIDVGLDGTIILRARKRRRPKNVDLQKIQTGKSNSAQEKRSVSQKVPPTPPAYALQTMSPALSRLRAVLQKRGIIPFQAGSQSTERNSLNVSSDPTGFVHTTDYKVSRTLSQGKPIQFSSNAEKTGKDRKNPNEKQQKNIKNHGKQYTTEE